MDKFKALVHYVIQHCDDPEKLGATRLNKILWYSDVASYLAAGSSMTGTQYVRRDHGPVPAHVLKTLKELREEGSISVKEPDGPFQVREFKSVKQADDAMFSDYEKYLISHVMEDICENHTAASISLASHDVAWRAADEGEEIPLEALLVSNEGDYRTEVQEWGSQVLDRLQ